jgi:hypothetical protein
MIVKTQIIEVPLQGKQSPMSDVKTYIDSLETAEFRVLRWGILNIVEDRAEVEIAKIEDFQNALKNLQNISCTSDHFTGVNVALIVPTGVGASIGGFVGDAGPVTRVLEEVADNVIVHPNVVNGADFFGGVKSLYVDGYHLDRLLTGEIGLGKICRPRIGLLLDKLTRAQQVKLLNAANAICAVKGIEMVGYTAFDEKLEAIVSSVNRNGNHFIGEIKNPEVMISPALRLKQEGANCIAVVTCIQGVSDADWEKHYLGEGTNPIGALEALISRTITLITGLPCAHAPAQVELTGMDAQNVDPRAASELVSGTSLPCILEGFRNVGAKAQSAGLKVNQLSAIIVPADCVGGAAATAALEFDIPLVAVRENDCNIGLPINLAKIPSTVIVDTYAEAVAFIACLRARVSWPSIRRPLKALREIGK